MKDFIIGITLIVMLFFMPWASVLGIDTTWVYRYNGSIDGDDKAYEIILDSAENVYVTGYSVGGSATKDIVTIKYNSDGSLGWINRYNGPLNYDDQGAAIAINDSGNVFVTGYGNTSFGDYLTIKYDVNGDTVWVKSYEGPGTYVDCAVDMVIDNEGNVIVTGYSYGIGTGSDFCTVKYDHNGDTIWTTRYNNEDENDTDDAYALTIDDLNNIYVTGCSNGGSTGLDFVTIKYDSNGDTVWVRRYDGSGGDDEPYGIKVDGLYNVYVTGESMTEDNDYDYLTIKYNANGDQQWVRNYNNDDADSSDRAQTMAVDNSGNVYVCGDSYGEAGDLDIAIVKYDSVGDTIWIKRFPASGSYDYSNDIVVDDHENIYFTGRSGNDIIIIKYDSSGSVVWSKTYDGPDGLVDWGRSIALGEQGNVYITGWSESSITDYDYITIKYNQSCIESVNPSSNALNVPANSDITVTFDTDMDPSTINDTTFIIHARSTGYHSGIISYDVPSRSATYDPDVKFAVGEVVSVTLTDNIESDLGVPLPQGIVWQFTIEVIGGSGTFTRDPYYSNYTDDGNGKPVYAADFDNDGNQDIIVGNAASSSSAITPLISIYLNPNGDGNLIFDSSYEAYDAPRSIVTADFNNDGAIDIANGSDKQAVSIFINRGDGTFDPYVNYTAGTLGESVPNKLAAADFNADGCIDLVSANFFSHNISLFLGNCGGTLSPQSIIASGSDFNHICAADFDNDNDIDIATTSYHDHIVTILFNNGDGVYGADSTYSIGDTGVYLFAANLNADNLMDLGVSKYFSDSILVMINNGDGYFVPDSAYPVGLHPRSGYFGDLNNNGAIDIISGDQIWGQISLLFNNGDGTYGNITTYGVGENVVSVFTADLDNDGDLEIITGNLTIDNDDISVFRNVDKPDIVSVMPEQNELNVSTTSNISVTFNTEMDPASINDTTFVINASQTGLHSGIISYDAPSHTATFDPNDDLAVGEVVTVTLTGNIKSDQDIALSVAYAWQFTVEALGGTGHYVLDSIYQIGGELNQALAADFDGDDYLDIIVMTTHDTGMYIMHNLGNGDFAAPNFIRFGEYDTTTYGVCVADYNSDGYLDVATSKQTEDSIMIIYNDGTGNFNSYDYYAVIPDPQYSSSADINGDGYFDIITPSHTTDSISVLINDGLGTFLPYSSYPVNGEGPLVVAVCDYDNDYDMDIATVEHAGDTGTVLLNNGNGTFIMGFGLSTGLLPVGIVGADLNNNGFIDLAIANGTSDSVYILLNDGGANFTVNSIYGVGNRPNYIISGDLNCDGFMDLSTIDLFSRNLSILLNYGDGTFAPNITFSTDTLSPQPHFAADLDNDGDLDIVLAASGNICIFMNQGEIQVTNTDDLGPGSLRWAIESANTDPQPNDIVFAVSGTIKFDSELPTFTDDNTRILGSTAPGGEYSVVFDGSSKAVSGSGLTIQSSNNYIEGLTITGFSDNGIEVTGVSSTGNTLTNNLIYGNGLLGINLGDDSVTANDPGDSDSGPNDLLNFPEVDSVYMNPDSTFSVYGTAADSAIIEFFVAHPAGDTAHPAGDTAYPADPTGYGEAYSYIGSDTCDENGDFDYLIPNTISQLSVITATATDTFGNTSEFCENFTLIPGPLIIVGYSSPNVIDLFVTDPEGFYICKDSATLSPATYTDSITDSVHIPNPKTGEYTIIVFADEGASRAAYSVGVRLDGTNEVILVDRNTLPPGGYDTCSYEVEEGWHYINGDANRDTTVNIFDITHIISYLYLSGSAPWPVNAADANCDLVVNIFDITYLITYLYLGGPPPCNMEE